MAHRSRATPIPGVFLLLLGGCGAPSPSVHSRPAGATLTIEPAADPGAAPRVLRLHVSGLDVEPSSIVLVRGELGTHYSALLRTGDLPSAVADRAAPARSWVTDETGDVVVAPIAPLDDGPYTLAALGVGRIAGLTVDAAASGPYATRLWPPRDAARGGVRWVFCGGEPRVEAGQLVLLEPAGATARVRAGVDDASMFAERCLHFDAIDAPVDAVALPPPWLGGVALEPTPLVTGPSPDAEPGACQSGESAAGTLCAAVDDDRAVVRAGDAPALLALRAAGQEWVGSLLPFQRFAVPGLPPAGAVAVTGSTTDLGGHETPFEVLWHTREPRPHVVLNEVLANPIGAESRSEWVEIVNDGTIAVDVGGWLFEDAGGAVALPRGALPPGAFALIVPAGFVVGASADVPPREGTLLLRVEHLGQGGISNSGEVLRLRRPGGEVLSEFPALPSPHAGVSLSRARPYALDDDASAFLESADEGASPGWENHGVSP